MRRGLVFNTTSYLFIFINITSIYSTVVYIYYKIKTFERPINWRLPIVYCIVYPSSSHTISSFEWRNLKENWWRLYRSWFRPISKWYQVNRVVHNPWTIHVCVFSKLHITITTKSMFKEKNHYVTHRCVQALKMYRSVNVGNDPKVSNKCLF